MNRNSTKAFLSALGMDRYEVDEVISSINYCYKPFDLLKSIDEDGSKKWRHIDNPVDELKYLQKKIYEKILKPVAIGLPPLPHRWTPR